MLRRVRSVRAIWAALGLAGIFALPGGVSPRLSADATTAPARASTPAAGSPFRLGTAGRPFAWSTAIGDLNADGRPDYAVADRIGRGPAGFEYSVELSISGRAVQSIAFASANAALSISLRDVDHDHDLDVVVSDVLSPAGVRVWLNDGRGAFAETSARPDAVDWTSAPSVAQSAPRGVAAASVPRRADDVPTSVEAAPFDLVPQPFESTAAVDPAIASPAPALQPRAPPVPTSPLF